MTTLLIFGFSTFGREIAIALREKGLSFLVADNDQERLERAKSFDFPTAHVDITSDEELVGLGVGSTITQIFCLMPKDQENLFLALSCRNLDPLLTIISSYEVPSMRERLLFAGSNKVIDPYEIASLKVIDTITNPLAREVIESILFGEHPLQIAQILITKDSSFEQTLLDPRSIKERYALSVLGIVDDAFSYSFLLLTEGHTHHLTCGDTLIVLGNKEDIALFKKENRCE